ncbi:hypothetical protein [Luteipulveratus mongoliensis]|uniref:Transmembrane protein n=1 Tax=Luteipulveratus mongoliensis TaxID=571913 RepID=A0A0K1JGK7_9MICO|nr:hypothetical protein [Luteipulveratus mongoliensis]AKU15708.1 hypothetical protein VV02_07340 [Luteipulveratus mongoliensis]
MTQFAALRERPPRRRRRLSEPRPYELHLGFGLLALVWLALCGVALWSSTDRGSKGDLGWTIFWLVAISAWFARGWWGGPTAWVFAKFAAGVFGMLFAFSVLVFLVLAIATHEAIGQIALYLLPTAAVSAMLLWSRRLLAGSAVTRWFYAE